MNTIHLELNNDYLMAPANILLQIHYYLISVIQLTSDTNWIGGHTRNGMENQDDSGGRILNGYAGVIVVCNFL